eukprot:CAMPEP_0175040552 /NCGR_PEP_ID=MMETSP0052_2-20121109/1337_1 /TAXON_ID=51329 ORGANISM="Polytomella parva, Strain SAG 63-3" /NCGR_SAMPLE_ID=MMETSP0052_2 /ASSEMBLY_ACC=CAM_ASM_000194 /LENGTH=84 /DNA_ID=CAMNT_0016302797 /DNA_START=86 /DNA_END=340 /DNA_ORIENTATION=+
MESHDFEVLLPGLPGLHHDLTTHRVLGVVIQVLEVFSCQGSGLTQLTGVLTQERSGRDDDGGAGIDPDVSSSGASSPRASSSSS